MTRHLPIASVGGDSSPASLPLLVLVIEGIGELGTSPGKGMSRHLAVGHPDGSATAWRLVSESRWKQPVVSPSTGEPDPVEWPTAAIDRLLDIVAGKRIAAFDPKKTTRYLRRLGKIAGRGAIPPIEDYVDIAEGLGMKEMHFRTLMETIEGPCLAKDFATAAQLASCFIQMMARQRHGRARRAPPPSNR